MPPAVAAAVAIVLQEFLKESGKAAGKEVGTAVGKFLVRLMGLTEDKPQKINIEQLVERFAAEVRDIVHRENEIQDIREIASELSAMPVISRFGAALEPDDASRVYQDSFVTVTTIKARILPIGLEYIALYSVAFSIQMFVLFDLYRMQPTGKLKTFILSTIEDAQQEFEKWKADVTKEQRDRVWSRVEEKTITPIGSLFPDRWGPPPPPPPPPYQVYFMQWYVYAMKGLDAPVNSDAEPGRHVLARWDRLQDVPAYKKTLEERTESARTQLVEMAFKAYQNEVPDILRQFKEAANALKA